MTTRPVGKSANVKFQAALICGEIAVEADLARDRGTEFLGAHARGIDAFLVEALDPVGAATSMT